MRSNKLFLDSEEEEEIDENVDIVRKNAKKPKSQKAWYLMEEKSLFSRSQKLFI